MIPNKTTTAGRETLFQNPFTPKGQKIKRFEKKDQGGRSLFGFFRKLHYQNIFFSKEDFNDAFQGLGLNESELNEFLYSSGNRFD